MKERKKTEVQLNYTASVPSAPMNVLLIMLVLNTSISVEGMQNWALFIRIAVSIAVVLLALLRFKLYIEESKLTYEITLYKLSLYKRRIAPNQIKNIKFIRVGWAQKAAIIQVKKGFNIRVINFKPTVYPKLIAFAKKHSISITKTNEYLLLEKASRQTPIQQEEKV
ncbi:MAG TPA: hypothetical protein VNQ57_02855 [Ureibacillus sp.]|nr:hypothetical protein [Ureibacillus sp.]